jgi:signal transduction histidine kinase
MITLDMPDWSAITTLLDRFRSEMREAVISTQGHIDIINQTIAHVDPEDDATALSKRITGFTRLIGIHMDRVARLMEMLERLEAIRTGTIREETRTRRRRIDIADFMEDFEEELDEISLVDLETEAGDHRSRLEVNIVDEVYAAASPAHLTRILQDILRNAIMYSMKATPIKISVQAKNRSVQIDVADQGYGIRASERERVFEAFARALQPQIIGEFGYGLSLYLCKHEVEAMNGRMWFESQENIGTTFSVMLPAWQDDSPSSSATNQT